MPRPVSLRGGEGSEGIQPMENRLIELDGKMAQVAERMASYPASLSHIPVDFLAKLDLSWIYHDHALEGVVLSYSELKAAIDSRIISDVTLIPMYEEIKRQKDAIDWIREQAKAQKKRGNINLDTIKKLHDFLSPELAGKPLAFRKENPIHRLYYHDISTPDKIQAQIKKLIEWMESDEALSMHLVRRAAVAHYRLLAIYPWTKNSGRVARLLMNSMLVREGYLPCVIHAIDRQRYYEVMRSESSGIIPLVIESLENGADTALKFLDEVDAARRQKRAS
jgi:Fic family protein